MTKKKIVIVATHPIQYHIPWFRELSERVDIDLTVLYGMHPDKKQQSDGFDKEFEWDIPLLEGYSSQLLNNKSQSPSVTNFSGIDCPDIRKVLLEINPDAVILTGWQSKILIQAWWAALRLKIKIVMRGESNAMVSRPWYKSFIHRILLSRVDAFLAIGSSNKQFYLNNGIVQAKIFSAPYFVENSRFTKALQNPKHSRNELRTNNNIDADSFCFVYSGKLIEKKNVLEILEAFLLSYKKHNTARLMVIGSGAQNHDLQKFADLHQLPVSFVGFVNQSEIPDLYSLGDCFVLASNYGETWGLVVNEAMVCGMPAIVSDRVGCGPDLVIPNETGLIYRFGDISALSEQMNFMLENPQTAAKMGRTAQNLVQLEFTATKTTDATVAALNAILE